MATHTNDNNYQVEYNTLNHAQQGLLQSHAWRLTSCSADGTANTTPTPPTPTAPEPPTSTPRSTDDATGRWLDDGGAVVEGD